MQVLVLHAKLLVKAVVIGVQIVSGIIVVASDWTLVVLVVIVAEFNGLTGNGARIS